MAGFGYPDKPVSTTSEDLFNVEVYIDGLCEFVKNCDTPMTISIQGDWGSGKTSMMNMVKDKLQGQIWPVWFNTWQFSQFDMGNSLVFSMMAVLLKELGTGNETIKKVLDGFAGFGRTVLKVVTDKTVCGSAAEMVSDALSPDAAVDYANEVTELKKKFQDAVNNKLEKEKCDRIVVFVDDLDRLQPAKAIELLEVLKLFLDCEKCVFVLAVDYEVVTLGIKQKFGDDVSEEKGKSFFDKIIQLPFKMPVAQYNIKKYVQDALSHMGVNENESGLYVSLIQSSIGFNPRSMKRLFNTFQLLDIISKRTVTDIDEGIRKRILFAIICMQTRFEGLYRYFATMPGSLDEDSIKIFIDDNAFNKILDDDELSHIITDNDSDIEGQVKKICKFMVFFVRSMQLDTDSAISQEEIALLEKVLKCSMVTSITETEENTETDIERDYRWQNRQIVKNVNDLLSENYGKMETWLPRKARPGIKLSDVSGYQYFTTKQGMKIDLEYYLVRENEFKLTVYILLKDRSKNAKAFFETFGENPLSMFDAVLEKKDYGGFDYKIEPDLEVDDKEIVKKVADLWIQAYEEIKKVYLD